MGAPQKLMACVTDTFYSNGGSGGPEGRVMVLHFSVSDCRLHSIPCLLLFL